MRPTIVWRSENQVEGSLRYLRTFDFPQMRKSPNTFMLYIIDFDSHHMKYCASQNKGPQMSWRSHIKTLHIIEKHG